MEKRHSILDRAAGVVVAMAFLVIGMMLIVLGSTFLPVIGILAALPVMAMSLRFLTLKPELHARLDEQRAVEPVGICIEHETWCPWPQPTIPQEAA
jgi:hypothetical protein